MFNYIKRTSAMTVCERYSQHCFEQNDSHGQDIADRIFDDIVEIPTKDVVEVVRCKDCVCFSYFIEPVKGYIGKCGVTQVLKRDDNFFCRDGVRKMAQRIEGADNEKL